MLTPEADLAVQTNGVDGLEKKVERHQDTVTKILEVFNESLVAESAKREETDRQVANCQYEVKNVKGRIGGIEHKFKAMSNDVEELEVAVAEVKNDNSFMAATTPTTNTKGDAGLSTFVYDRMDKLEKMVKELEDDVSTHRVILNELGREKRQIDRYDGGSKQEGWAFASIENGSAAFASKSAGKRPVKFEDRDKMGSVSIVPASRPRVYATANKTLTAQEIVPNDFASPKKELDILKADIQALKITILNEKDEKRTIDGCPTRDALIGMYRKYTKDMDETPSGAYQDRLWDMRGRVITRLAMFDVYGRALQEARTAELL